MAQETGHARVCPTRIDAAPALFAHRVTTAQCHDRQRGLYHKCYTCAFNHAYVALHGPPSKVRPAAKLRAQKSADEPVEVETLDPVDEPVVEEAPATEPQPEEAAPAASDVGLRAV